MEVCDEAFILFHRKEWKEHIRLMLIMFSYRAIRSTSTPGRCWSNLIYWSNIWRIESRKSIIISHDIHICYELSLSTQCASVLYSSGFKSAQIKELRHSVFALFIFINKFWWQDWPILLVWKYDQCVLLCFFKNMFRYIISPSLIQCSSLYFSYLKSH